MDRYETSCSPSQAARQVRYVALHAISSRPQLTKERLGYIARQLPPAGGLRAPSWVTGQAYTFSFAGIVKNFPHCPSRLRVLWFYERALKEGAVSVVTCAREVKQRVLNQLIKELGGVVRPALARWSSTFRLAFLMIAAAIAAATYARLK